MDFYSARYLTGSYVMAALAAVYLSACDGRPVAPRISNSTAEAAARAGTDLNLYTYVGSVSQIGTQWNDNARNETGWEVHRSTDRASGTFTLRGTMAADVTSYVDTALAQLTEYCYEVRSFRVTGGRKSYDAFSNVSCTTTPSLPAPPTGVHVVAGPSYADMSWTNSVSQTDSTRLERSAHIGGPWQRIATFTPSYLPNATSYLEYGLPLEQPVCYRLIAFNRWGASDPSNTPCTAPIAPPSDLVAVSKDGHSVTLTWKDNSAYEDGYVVSRGPDGYTWTVIADLPSNTSSYSDASIALDIRYAYRVQAKKDGTVTAQAGPAWIAVASGPPLAPADVTAYPGGSTAAWFGWYSPSITASSFRVERSTDGQRTWQFAGTNTQPYILDQQRTPEQEVCYRVYAINSYGASSPSPVDCTMPPLAPTNVAVTPQADGAQLVSWTDNSNVEDGYIVFVYYDPGCSGDNCYYFCYPDGCYWVRCEGDGCYRPPIEERSYAVAANATSQRIDGSEIFGAVYAARDGGYSDAGTLAAGSVIAAAGLSATSMRAPSATRRLPPMRKAPKGRVIRP